jgi:transcriptional regulator with XRE-family HTH domain
MDLGKSIKVCRVHKGWSQEQLAAKANISVSYLSLIEQNKRDPPLSTIDQIAGALHVPLNMLLFLGSKPDEVNSIPKELREKLAAAVLSIIGAQSD